MFKADLTKVTCCLTPNSFYLSFERGVDNCARVMLNSFSVTGHMIFNAMNDEF